MWYAVLSLDRGCFAASNRVCRARVIRTARTFDQFSSRLLLVLFGFVLNHTVAEVQGAAEPRERRDEK